MSAVDQVARLLALVPWLLERPGASLSEAADALGVDPATVREDLKTLDFTGVPGLGGGHVLEVALYGDRVVLRMADELSSPLRPTAREALQLVLSLSGVAELLGDELPALRSALAKIRDALGVPESTAAHGGADAPWLAEVHRAVRDGRRVRITYRGRRDDRPRPRTVDPWALRVRDGHWYLQGRDADAGALRTFRLDRAREVTVLDQPRAAGPPAGGDADLPEPVYVPGPEDVRVEVVLEPGGRWVADAVSVEHREELDGGRLRAVFRTDAPDHVARLLLAAGPDVRRIDPPGMADRVRGLAAAALERYRS